MNFCHHDEGEANICLTAAIGRIPNVKRFHNHTSTDFCRVAEPGVAQGAVVNYKDIADLCGDDPL
jgi:hypothetical protein